LVANAPPTAFGCPFALSNNCTTPVFNDGCSTDANTYACGAECCGSCGDNVRGGFEQCDGSDATFCPGTCQADCTCPQVCGDNLREPPEECDGSDNPCSGPCQVDCTCQPYRIVFVTNTTYTGNLGGVSGADALCDALGVQFGSPWWVWRAWISDSASSPSTRFTHWAGPYVSAGSGYTIASDWADLTDGTLAYPIELLGQTVWTATNPDGTYVGSTYGDCSGWTVGSSLENGETGSSSETGSGWSLYGGDDGCGNPHHLYCFQQ
jgi:hypothetical protein